MLKNNIRMFESLVNSQLSLFRNNSDVEEVSCHECMERAKAKLNKRTKKSGCVTITSMSS